MKSVAVTKSKNMPIAEGFSALSLEELLNVSAAQVALQKRTDIEANKNFNIIA
jgi:hypothetical protein